MVGPGFVGARHTFRRSAPRGTISYCLTVGANSTRLTNMAATMRVLASVPVCKTRNPAPSRNAAAARPAVKSICPRVASLGWVFLCPAHF